MADTQELDAVKRMLLDAADQAGPLHADLAGVAARVGRRRRNRRCAVGLAVGCATAVVVAAVQIATGASSGPADTAAAAQATRPACVTAPPAGTPAFREVGDVGTCQYLGLTLGAARSQAAKEHRELRVVSQDGVRFTITYDHRPTRVDVVIVNDRVTSAGIG
ncbi:hypothetical protein [Streptacidiphilus sp. PAMC 29251]